ncbi:hypothetical protein KSS87_022440 [Heliosperma pusillum]|nr:hypothetical protein KSS87_022440 [Heliosperma pusillum]
MSIKARIKALLADSVRKRGKVNSIQEHEMLALKDVCNDLGAPTLMSFLKASNPKLLTAINPADESANLSRAESFKHNESMEEYMGVFELFKVDQDAFLKILRDSPRKKHKLVKSGSFPFSNDQSRNSVTFGKTPKKLEHKINEVWPIHYQQGYELRKSRSQNIGRSSSLKGSLDRYGPLIDATSKNEDILNKQLSKSLKLTTEKDFEILSCRYGWGSSSFGIEQGENIPQLEIIAERSGDHDCKTNKEISSVSGIDMHSQHDQTENLEHCPIVEDSVTTYHSTVENVEEVQSPDLHSVAFGKDEIDSTESLQYVKFVLNIVGFTTTYDQLGVWHTLHQLLDPVLFDDVEICYTFEPKPSSKKEIVMSTSQRKILFDLLNEALLKIHETSYAYFPKPLTSSCVVHPVRKEENWIVEQVCEFISEYLLWQPENDEDFDGVIVHELSRQKSGWSNLQRDTEVLAVDLEDWIFDELLDEIVYCQVIEQSYFSR